jgi:hypothetical protein
MRQITQDVIRAFWQGVKFNRANSSVEITEHCVVLKLHGNAIARRDIGNKQVFAICDGGWTSNTTKERLNGLRGVRIYQKDWQWYLNGQCWEGVWTTIKL